LFDFPTVACGLPALLRCKTAILLFFPLVPHRILVENAGSVIRHAGPIFCEALSFMAARYSSVLFSTPMNFDVTRFLIWLLAPPTIASPALFLRVFLVQVFITNCNRVILLRPAWVRRQPGSCKSLSILVVVRTISLLCPFFHLSSGSLLEISLISFLVTSHIVPITIWQVFETRPFFRPFCFQGADTGSTSSEFKARSPFEL